MRTFKEQMELDARAVFLNPAEFGEAMVVDGIDCWGQWDDAIQTVDKFLGSRNDVLGVNTVERLLFVLPQDPDVHFALPVPEQELDVDGENWLVRDAMPEGAITKVTLYRNES